METDRQDLVQAITKLKESINELNQKEEKDFSRPSRKLIENLMKCIQNFLTEEMLN